MTTLAAVALAGCLAMDAGSDRVMLRDLAPAFPGWDAATPGVPVALAPAPGTQRWFRLPELRRIAARLSLTVAPATEVCVERTVAPLDPASLLEAMHGQLPEASIEILEYSRLPAPQGKLEFPRSGLRQTPAGGFWSGSVTYAGNHRFLIWARVKVLAPATRVIAAENLKPGQTVQASQLRVERREEFPSSEPFPGSVEEVAGRVLQRPVPAGTALSSRWLGVPQEVARGETVHVEVWSGGAHLEFEGEAEASGSAGQAILVRNPVSKKRFLARVVGKGQVVVGKANL